MGVLRCASASKIFESENHCTPYESSVGRRRVMNLLSKKEKYFGFPAQRNHHEPGIAVMCVCVPMIRCLKPSQLCRKVNRCVHDVS